jgi:hypothetical protein
VPLHQDGEGRLFPVPAKALEQLPVAQVRSQPGAGQVPDLVQGVEGSARVHRFVLRRRKDLTLLCPAGAI